ncbi:MAG: hypothetical protein WCV62_01835 [Candidatus Peribacteraceae bacterium]|jgi:uncharacterized membrane protein
MPLLKRLAPSFLLLSLLRPMEKTMHRAQRIMTLAVATLAVTLIAFVIIAIAAALWIVAFFRDWPAS